MVNNMSNNEDENSWVAMETLLGPMFGGRKEEMSVMVSALSYVVAGGGAIADSLSGGGGGADHVMNQDSISAHG